MADWESLKRLRLHKNIMTFVVICLLLGLIYNITHHRYGKQTTSSGLSQTEYFVTAKSGLNIHESGNKNSNTLISVPYKGKVTLLEKDSVTDIINGKSGFWYKVEYKGTIGYAWGLLLERK